MNRPLVLIVDGDNVVRTLKILRPPEVERFLQRLEMATVSRDWEIIVVFDGPERFLPREEGPLVVRYSLGKTADTLIERLVYQSPDRAGVVVVTQDRAQANVVSGFGARVWDAQRLIQEMGYNS